MNKTSVAIYLTNPKDFELIKEFLASYYSVQIMENLSHSNWQILILDLWMAQKHYQELIKISNSQKPLYCPILILAQNSLISEIPQEIWNLADDILPIPVSQKLLLTKVKVLARLHSFSLQLDFANKTKEKFLSIIAHDLKNSFHAILGLSSELEHNLENSTNHEQKTIAQNIHLTAQGTYELFENLLNWAKSQKGGIEFNPKHNLIFEIAERNIHLLNQIASRKQIHIENRVNNDITVYSDEDMLHVVLRNLLTNAIKFTHINGKIEVLAEELDSEFIKISIIDSGIGIPKEKIENLFNLNTKNTSLGTNLETGTGLGLLLCKEFVERHGGKIFVTSQAGQGSSFSFTLPKGDRTLVEQKNDTQETTEKQISHLGILAAEDEAISQKLLELILTKYGHTIKVCENGEELLQQIHNFHPNLILLDLEMPILNGEKTIQRIKEILPSLRVPIYAMTGHDLSENWEYFRQLGFTGYITKPFTYKSFLQQVHFD